MHNKTRTWLLFILIIVSLAINTYFRLWPLFFSYITESAKDEVYAKFKTELHNNISATYPNSGNLVNEKLFNTLFKEYIKQKETEVNMAVLEKVKELKNYFHDDRGWPYLIETDSYRWFRRIENFVNTGHFGTNRINNQEYDNLRSAPFGAKVEPLKLHFYIGAYFYKILHWFNNKLSLMNTLDILPVFLSLIMIILIFWLTSLLGISYLGSFIVSLVFGLADIVLLRTSFAWFDTDIYNLILPLVIMSTLACSFKHSHLKRYFYLLLSGLLIGIYSALWSVWWLIFYIFILGICLYELEIIIYDKQNSLLVKLREFCICILIFVFCSYLSVLLISGFDVIKMSFRDALSFLSLRQNLTLDNFWPSLAFTVGELKRAQITDIILNVGGSFILYGGVIGLLLLFIRKKQHIDYDEKRFLSFILFIWLLVALALTHFGVRFILFLVIPIGISIGVSWDFLIDFLNKKQNSSLLFKKVHKKIKVLFLPCLFIIVSMLPINNALKVRPPYYMMNNTMWKMLLKIKEVTPENAIIAAGWELGDYIMSISKRATLHDPSFQHTPIAYWFNRALLTKNEEEAVRILKMLSAGGNKAFEELAQLLNNDKFAAIELMNKILLLKEEESLAVLNKYNFSNDRVDKILKLIYTPTRPAYVIVYYHMLRFVSNIGILGGWDFNKLELWQKSLKLKKNDFMHYAKERFGYSERYSEEIYDSLKLMDEPDILRWIAPGKYEFYGVYSEQGIRGDDRIILFNNGLMVDSENLKAYFNDAFSRKWVTIGHVILMTKDGMKENINNKGDADYSVLLTQKNDNTYKAILSSTPLAGTLFFRLYFTNGMGLKHFELINHESKNEKNDIYLYKVN